jgi:hypothetical protein
MTASRILAGRDTEGPASTWGDLDWAWSVLYGIGWLFLILGATDIGLLWVPFRFGVPEYEFASVGSMLDALPLPTMGLVFLLAGAGARRKAGAVRLVIVVSLLAALVVVAAAALYALTVPLALKAVTGPGLKLGIEKAIAKVAVQAVAYPIAYVGIARMGLGLLAKSKRKHGGGA